MKRILAIALCAAMLAATLTACNNNGSADTTTTAAPEVTTTAEETTAEDTTAEDTTPSDGENTGANKCTEILDSIKTAYGENYLPSMSIDPMTLESMFAITSDLYAEFAGEMMMISTYPDTVMIFKAADGQADALEAALNTLRDNKMADQMQYPINIAKVNATKVVRNGDYVAFLLIGAVDEREDATEDEASQFAEEQVQIAVSAFEAAF